VKIQEILGVCLENPDVRLRLLISYKILELYSGKSDETSSPDCDHPENLLSIE
jgi:hypothetical protein